jgi:hypothetical protein
MADSTTAPTFEQISKTVTQSILALGCVGVIVWSLATGHAVEPGLTAIAGVIVGWYFGKNNVLDIAKAITAARAPAPCPPESPEAPAQVGPDPEPDQSTKPNKFVK